MHREERWALEEAVGAEAAAQVADLAGLWPGVAEATDELLEALFSELASGAERETRKSALQAALDDMSAASAIEEVKRLPESTPADLQARTFKEFFGLYSVRLK